MIGMKYTMTIAAALQTIGVSHLPQGTTNEAQALKMKANYGTIIGQVADEHEEGRASATTAYAATRPPAGQGYKWDNESQQYWRWDEPTQLYHAWGVALKYYINISGSGSGTGSEENADFKLVLNGNTTSTNSGLSVNLKADTVYYFYYHKRILPSEMIYYPSSIKVIQGMGSICAITDDNNEEIYKRPDYDIPKRSGLYADISQGAMYHVDLPTVKFADKDNVLGTLWYDNDIRGNLSNKVSGDGVELEVIQAKIPITFSNKFLHHVMYNNNAVQLLLAGYFNTK